MLLSIFGRVTYEKDVEVNRQWINSIRWIVAVGLVVGCGAFTSERALGAKDGKAPRATDTDEPLQLLLRDTPKPNYGVPVPEQITGRITLGSKEKSAGVEGVSVTDGYSVVKTDTDGHYTLTPNPSAVFIYVTRPAGYDVTGDWYQPVVAEVNFSLQAAVDDEREYTFVHVTDAHIMDDIRSIQGLSRFVKELNALTPKPRFVVNSGDLINLSKSLGGSPDAAHKQLSSYVGIMNHLAMPHYNVAGDHTDSSYRIADFPRGDHRCGKPLFWEYLGPHFFSFEYGKIHFVSVDSGYHLGKRQILVNGQSREYPTNKVQPMHTAWMKEDMAGRTTGTFLVSTSESDLCHVCPEFAEMARQYDVRLQLVGDNHVLSQKLVSRKGDAVPYQTGGFVPYRTGGALSGCWWNPKCRQLCPDLNPQGYLIYGVRGEELEYFYKGLGQRVAFVSQRLGAPWRGQVTVQAHLVQPQAKETLQYTLDGNDWHEMQETGRPFYRTVYEATVDSTALANGLAELQVRSSLTEETRSREFVVVNDSTPAEFKTDAMLTLSTAAALQHPPAAPVGGVDVLVNDEVVGVLSAGVLEDYSFRIPAAGLRKVNTLGFRFHDTDDGMYISSPVLTFQNKPFRDPRDEAIKEVRVAHWGSTADEWGGFFVGDGDWIETTFVRKQDTFCFILTAAD